METILLARFRFKRIGTRIYSSLKPLVFLISIYLCGCNHGDTNKYNADNAESYIGIWEIDSVHPKMRHKDNDEVVGTNNICIKVLSDVFCGVNSTICNPVYKAEIVKVYSQEGEVPSPAVKRTSYFYGYENNRKTIQLVNVYSSSGNYYGSFEYVEDKDKIIIMNEDSFYVLRRIMKRTN